MRFPTWAIVAFPVPCLLIVLDALGPFPLFVRWRVGFGPTGTRWVSTMLIGITLAVAWVALSTPTPRSDQPPVITCAARDLWRGINPYDTYEPQCLAQLRLSSAGATPLEAGPFRKDTSYPSPTQVTAALRQDEQRGGHAGFSAYGYPPDAPLLILPVAFAGWAGSPSG